MSATSVQPGARPSSVRRVVVASLVGTSLEWYDFFIYGTAAALVFNQLFFPSFDPLVGTLLAFTTYAVGFVARPLGGIVFGHYGDRVGRKNVLVITLLLMGIATFAIGLLPTYEVIGVWAPILLVTLRFLQGLGLGGEWGGAVLMTLESGDRTKRGLNASWPQVGVPVGLLLANGVLSLMGAVTADDAFLSWGWRVPFLLSGLLVLVGLWIRMTGGGEPRVREGRVHARQGPRPDRRRAAQLPTPGPARGRRPHRRGRRLLHLRLVHHHLRHHVPRAAAELRAQRGTHRRGVPGRDDPAVRRTVRPLRPPSGLPRSAPSVRRSGRSRSSPCSTPAASP